MSLTPRIDKLERNLLINGDMTILQRPSGALTGTSVAQYKTDRWTGWFPAAGSYTSPQIYQSSLPAGFPGLASTTRAHRLVTSTCDALGSHVMYQRIESLVLKKLESNSVSFGFWASVNNFQTCTIQLIQTPNGADTWTGQTIIAQESFTVDDNTGGWQYFKIEDATLVNKDGLECRVSFHSPETPGSSTDTYITEAMCNEGSEIKPFNLRGLDEVEEKNLCMRYYFSHVNSGSLNNQVCLGRMSSTVRTIAQYYLPVPMRVDEPLIDIAGAGDFTVQVGTGSAVVASSIGQRVSKATNAQISLDIQHPATGAAGQLALINFTFNGADGARMAFDAEL